LFDFFLPLDLTARTRHGRSQLFALLVALAGVVGCDVNDASPDAVTCRVPNCAEPDASALPTAPPIELGSSDATGGSEAPRAVKAACGRDEGTCLPDDVVSCQSYMPPGGIGSNPGSDLDAGSDAEASRDAGDAGSELDGSFVRNPPRDPERRVYACQVTPSETSESGVRRECAPSGTQTVNEACTSSVDCSPGMACVGPMHRGRCLYYCCGEGSDTCGAGYFCAEQPLRIESLGEADGPSVPVCSRAEQCPLAEPFPCEGERCVCGPDTACTLINTNGTTACLKPGSGTTNETCTAATDCAAGYVCSQATQRCVKTCDLDDAEHIACGDGRCQSTPTLPDGWGICVGVPMTNASLADP
jgi:hypothetical protein